MSIFNNDFKEYILLLNKHGVEYVLVGGMAVNIHGYRRSTGDMDIFVNPTKSNHLLLRRVHADFGMHMGDMENIDNFLDTKKFDVFTYGVAPVQIDVLTACKGITFDEAYQNAIKFKLEKNLECKVISYRELIVAKKAAGRFRDKADIEELQRIKSKNQ
ncbi:MAG: nucleotidyltransferase [Fulvivirga sp.]|uniref:nucleotidyltransferase n=1 Tax=Fulvivirga sp. TaxID=1931237 RepID=UPI0032F07277